MIYARVTGCISICEHDKQYVTNFNQAGISNICDIKNIESLVEIDNSENLRRSLVLQPIFAKDSVIEHYLKFTTQAIK